MIKIAGSVHRSFTFPAELPLAFTYYSDLGRILTYLPHISLVRAYAYNQFRMLYNTTELGTYRIRIFCDLQAQLDGKGHALLIKPLDIAPPVEPEAGLRSSMAQGFYSSRSVFRDKGDKTRVEYNLRLWANLPTPLGLRFMPGSVIGRIANNITNWRMREIADGFIERSIDAFPHWLAEMGQSDLATV
jgi:hypothetical protein